MPRKIAHDYRGGTLHARPQKKRIDMKVIYDGLTWLFGIFAAVFVAVALIYFIGIKTSVVGSSMEPGLMNGQEVLINRVVYQFSSPKRGDVIVFHPNGNQNTHFYVKRIIGLPGETIQIRQGTIYINGETYTGAIPGEIKEPGIAADEILLGEEDYFVLGDRRDNSEDSRSANIGNVTRGMIEGKAWFKLRYGKNKMGWVK